MDNSQVKTFVIHVKGETERERSIKNELSKQKIEAEFILEGNKEEIDDQILEKYFSGKMKKKESRTSCALKHLLVYERMIEKNIPLALILEDDITFYSNFKKIFPKVLEEIKQRDLENFLISLDDSNLRYVNGSEKKAGTLLYHKDRNRMAGAYLIDLKTAKALINCCLEEKCSLAIDWFHNYCTEKGIINIYWCEPTISCQGSLNGDMRSLIDNKKVGSYRNITFGLRRIYRKLIYKFR
ncbi:glycosyltransferase family 25 protein [Xanthovirga aplysinae]|uniref:glycosyltransferase family 25 protein n=1 Tax=Xanthovirga aplysinae TaxID=2529853 RepID=UPI0012BC4530|nr:glycosyltransferase family 25 protein [Xanthovirga aplysinae]MTI33090.1 glycosyltransferase family 25 protein [Xanthovirga aplysinae]